MKRRMEDFIDDGFVRAGKDYGDATANMGTLYFSLYAAQRLNLIPVNSLDKVSLGWWAYCLTLLEMKPGVLCRHPMPWSWTYSAEVMSRDQIRPMLRAACVLGDRAFLKRFAWGHAKRGFMFTTNCRRNHAYPKSSPYWRSDISYSWKLPDFTGISFMALLLRCLRVDIRPIFWAADLIAVLKSYQYVYEAPKTLAKRGHKGDLRNHIERLMFNKLYYNTWMNDWALKVFNRLDPQDAMELWFSERRKEPPMGDIMRPMITYIFGNKPKETR